MGRTIRPTALLIGLAAVAGSALLLGQTPQLRAKVSTELPHYAAAVAVKGTLEIAGTDALLDLGEEWGQAFRRYQPDARLAYAPKLSKEAARDLIDGTRSLIIIARDLTQDELKAFQAKYGYAPMRIPICLDATIVIVHKNNPISAISMEQLDAVYSKERRGGAPTAAVLWGDLGVRGGLGKRPITAYARAEGAATRDAFQNTVLLKGEYRAGIQPRDDSGALAEAVTTDETGLAIGSLASWYAAVKVLPIIPYKGTEPRFPSPENVTTGKYPMPRLYCAYVNRAPGQPLEPLLNEALHFLISQEGQGVAADTGILPAPPEFLSIAQKRLDR